MELWLLFLPTLAYLPSPWHASAVCGKFYFHSMYRMRIIHNQWDVVRLIWTKLFILWSILIELLSWLNCLNPKWYCFATADLTPTHTARYHSLMAAVTPTWIHSICTNFTSSFAFDSWALFGKYADRHSAGCCAYIT